MFFQMKHTLILCVMLISFAVFPAMGQLSDLDLLSDDDRSFGASVTAMPDPTTGAFAESRSAIMLLPLQIKVLNFEGGAGAYFTQSIVEGEVASALQWRVQGGPHWGKIGIQFYVEGFGSKASITPASCVSVNSISVGSSSLAVWARLCERTHKRNLGVPVLNATLPRVAIRKLKD